MTTTETPLGKPLPAVMLPTLDGTPVDLAALRGKKHIIFMWASW